MDACNKHINETFLEHGQDEGKPPSDAELKLSRQRNLTYDAYYRKMVTSFFMSL